MKIQSSYLSHLLLDAWCISRNKNESQMVNIQQIDTWSTIYDFYDTSFRKAKLVHSTETSHFNLLGRKGTKTKIIGRLFSVVKDAENNKNLFFYEKERFISTIKRPGIQSIKPTHDEYKNCFSPSSNEVIPFTLQPNNDIHYMKLRAMARNTHKQWKLMTKI